MLAEARVVHRLPGRLRLRFSQQRQDTAFFEALVTEMQACAGVNDIQVNPRSGSMLILHASDEQTLLRYAAERRLFAVGGEEIPATSVQAQVEEGVEGLRQTLQTITGRDVDLNAVVVAGLAALAIQQALAGNIMAPAVSLLWYAYSAAGTIPGGRRKEAETELADAEAHPDARSPNGDTRR